MSKDYTLTLTHWNGETTTETFERLEWAREAFKRAQDRSDYIRATIRGMGYVIEDWTRMGVKVERPHYRLTDEGWMPDGLSEGVA